MTDYQKEFCRNRVRHPEWNAAYCYLQSYPKCRSWNAAAVEASKNLRKPKIQAYIRQLREETDEPIGLIRARILKEEARIALCDPADFFDPITRQIRKITDVPEQARRAILGMTITERVINVASGDSESVAENSEIISRKISHSMNSYLPAR